MCGIVGYTGNRPAIPILLEGLASLEYRGYDSAGIAVLSPTGDVTVHKSPGKLKVLRDSIENGHPYGFTGIGHTRWATHGGPTVFNSHPHVDCNQDVIIAHNGIVENYIEIKRELLGQGHKFVSQTDSEVISHLIEAYLVEEYPMEEAIRRTAARLKGAHAVVVLHRKEPDKILAFRVGNAGGIVVGMGKDEAYLASDLPALLAHTRQVVYLGNGEMASVTPHGVQYSTLEGNRVSKEPTRAPYDALSVAKGNFKHFMLKEISEQPEAVLSALRGRVSFDTADVEMEGFPLSDNEIKKIQRIVLVGMGTSYNAAMVGRLWIESLANIQADADNASEFRYRGHVLDKNTLVVSLGQSGETADTLAAMEESVKRGARLITICNVEGSQATRLAEWTLAMRAGLEIGVASTKTFISSLVALYLLSVHLGVKRGALKSADLNEAVSGLANLPSAIGELLASHDQYKSLAYKFFKYSNFLFLGRGLNYPIAMEGALKLKEISYIHAEGYPAGEMKHGPIALIDDNMPVVALAPMDSWHEKMLSNISEVKTRGGIVIAIATEGDEDVAGKADHVIYLPQVPSKLLPLMTVVPLQLLAYYIAVRRGCDVDQPRNLAKSVTVE